MEILILECVQLFLRIKLIFATGLKKIPGGSKMKYKLKFLFIKD